MLKVLPLHSECEEMVYGGYNLRCPQKLWMKIESLWTRYDIGEHDGLGPDTWVGHMVGTNA